MSPSRLAFVQEFEQQLSSHPLGKWFAVACSREPGLQAFAHPETLRRFLHSKQSDRRKPEVWRALVKSLQLEPVPLARLFILGLLEPVLGHLVDKFDAVLIDPDDLWQETVACALKALANPMLPQRRQVLAGLAKDTHKYLRVWLREEFAKAKNEAPLFQSAYEVDFETGPESTDQGTLLARWCAQAGVNQTAAELIGATRVDAKKLADFAPTQSPAYYRLHHARSVAERQLKAWLLRRPM